jgi:hypothetical protein
MAIANRSKITRSLRAGSKDRPRATLEHAHNLDSLQAAYELVLFDYSDGGSHSGRLGLCCSVAELRFFSLF